MYLFLSLMVCMLHASSSAQFSQTTNCSQFTGQFCRDVIKWKVHADKQVKVIEERLTKMASLLKDISHVSEDCGIAYKSTTCSIFFPRCNPSRTTCKEVCSLLQSDICAEDWSKIKKIHMVLFKELPSCHMLPSKTNRSCDFPHGFLEILEKRQQASQSLTIAIACGVSGTILLLMVSLVVFFCKRKQRRIRSQKSSVKESHEVSKFIGEVSPVYTTTEQLVEALGINVFAKESLHFQEQLGEGAFGKVVMCKTSDNETVAVKYLKDNFTDEMQSNFQKEVEIIWNFKHENIVMLLGVCMDTSDNNHVMSMVLEFMKYGDLNEYIRKRSGCYHAIAGSCGNLPDGVEFSSPELSFHRLLHIIVQIADGLSYLAAKRFVHRDISARNILVGDELRVKISDFGLAQDIYGSDYYRVDSQRLLPLRWLSPEALNLGKFTIYSDVWSFGVTMWEIFTYGMQPFYGCSNDEVCQRIRCGKLLVRPYCCPNEVYDVMKSCWKFVPTHRKSCAHVRDVIKSWLINERKFIGDWWSLLCMPPLPDRPPTIKKFKNKHLQREFTL